MAIDQTTLQRVATLARLKPDAEEMARLARSLNDILLLVDQLQQADVADLAPLSHPLEITQPLRDDKVTAKNWQAEAMALAPAQQDGCYLVPQVLE